MALPVSAVATPAEPVRAVSARHFMRLKLRVMGNNFRGQGWRIALFLGGALVGLWFAISGFFLFAAPGLAGDGRYAVLIAGAGGGALLLGWLLLPWSSSGWTRRWTRPASHYCRYPAARCSPVCSPRP
ncbi:hypothetical protein GCM10027614_50270 [Micromonospora vulcania]